MICSFEKLLECVAQAPPRTIAVAAAHDDNVLLAVEDARRRKLINAVLIGDEARIRRIACEHAIELGGYDVLNRPDPGEACAAAVELVRRGQAALPMKGLVDTAVMLKAVLNRETGLRTGKLISHVGVYEIPGFDRMILVGDSAMTIAPTLDQKADIIRNCVAAAHALGIETPKVAVLCAVEKVTSSMPATLDAQALTEMNERGKLPGCLVKGPLQLDIAVSVDAARHKGMDHPVAGKADILLVPDIEAGNIFIKALEHFAKAQKAGIIMGAKCPIILTSRSSDDRSKLLSIALGLRIANEEVS